MALADDFSQGFLPKKDYITLSLVQPRHILGDNFDVALPIPQVSVSDVLAQAANLVSVKLIEISIQPFTIKWARPDLLPSYPPTAVLDDMKVTGNGYLRFALGADNQLKNEQQICDPNRVTKFYKLTYDQFLSQLSDILLADAATVNISMLSIKWLNRADPTPSLSTADAIAAIQQKLIYLESNQGDLWAFASKNYNELKDWVSGMQPAGNYATYEDMWKEVNSLKENFSQVWSNINELKNRIDFS